MTLASKSHKVLPAKHSRISVIADEEVLDFECSEDEVLLRAGLHAGLSLPYGCNVGACGSCKFQLLEGSVREDWPEAPGITARDRARGRYLACQARALSDCSVRFLGAAPELIGDILPTRATYRLVERLALTHDMFLLSFVTSRKVDFLPGQYGLLHVEGVNGPRAYSMANLPNADGQLDFIVKLKPDGKGSARLCRDLPIGEDIEIDGPYGFAGLRPHYDRDVVCIAGGSGLGPMVSVLRGFLDDPGFHNTRLWFLQGVREPRDLCDMSRLCGLAKTDTRLTVVTAFSAGDGATEGRMLHEILPTQSFRPLDSEIYLAGPPPMISASVEALRDIGVPPEHIHFDEFY